MQKQKNFNDSQLAIFSFFDVMAKNFSPNLILDFFFLQIFQKIKFYI